MKTKAEKLTRRESRALAYCNSILRAIADGYPAAVTVEWRKSRTWGMNPVILDFNDEPCTSVSGCGYCKHSTALAECLRFLAPADSPHRLAIHRAGGAGVSTVTARLADAGFILRPVASGRTFDAYELTAATPTPA